MSRRAAAVETPKLLPIHVAAGMIGCSENHIYRLIADGELDTVDIATPGARKSKTRITPEAIDAYIARKLRTA